MSAWSDEDLAKRDRQAVQEMPKPDETKGSAWFGKLVLAVIFVPTTLIVAYMLIAGE